MPSSPISDTRNNRETKSSLDLYSKVVDPDIQDELLDAVNLGTGNYSNREMWQQIQSFRDGLFASSAFSRLIFERAVHDTKMELSRYGWEWIDDDGEVHTFSGKRDDADYFAGPTDRSEYRRDRGEEIWAAMPIEQQQAAIQKFAGIGEDWTPPFWRMLKARHEASRSRGARLLDNVFGRVQQIISDDDEVMMGGK